MDSFGIFHPDTHLLTPKSQLWIPDHSNVIEKAGPPEALFDLPETSPTYLNFGYQHIFFLYPKKLSYLSRNAYIKKIRVRELGKPTCLLKNAYKLTSCFCDV